MDKRNNSNRQKNERREINRFRCAAYIEYTEHHCQAEDIRNN